MSSVGPGLPFGPEMAARLQRDWAAQDAREERAARRRRDELAARHADGQRLLPSESLAKALAAQDGRKLRTHEQVIAGASAEMDWQDYQQRKGRHPKGCSCERCIVGEIGPLQADEYRSSGPWEAGSGRLGHCRPGAAAAGSWWVRRSAGIVGSYLRGRPCQGKEQTRGNPFKPPPSVEARPG